MSNKNRYTLLLSNTAIFAAGNLLVKLISFFLMPLYTSVLTTEQYGVAELLNSAAEIALPIATLSIVEALYRFSIDKEEDHKALFVNSLVIVFFGDILVLLLSVFLRYVLNYRFALEFGLLYCTMSFYKLAIQFARGMGQTKRYAAYGVLNSLLLVASNYLLLVVNNGGIGAYLLSFSVSYGLSGVAAFVFSKEFLYLRPDKYDVSGLRRMLKYSVPNIPNMLSWWINSVSDRYIILLFFGSGLAGLYTAASKLPAMINLVTTIFQQAWQYSTAREIESADNESFFSNVFKVYSFVCIFICAALILVNKLICSFMLRSDFYAAWRFVPILLLSAAFGCYSSYFGTFYNALKNNNMLMVSTMIGAIFNIVLNFALIPIMGGIGAAIATAVSYAVIVLVRLFDIRKKVRLSIEYKKLTFQLTILTIYAVLASICESNITYILGILAIISISSADHRLIKSLFNALCLCQPSPKGKAF